MQAPIGILMINLGSPDSPRVRDVRKYLFEFLHDYRVVDTNRFLWCPILHGIILRTRPAKSAKAYASIWSESDGVDNGEAPLIRITRAQAAGVQQRLGEKAIVEIAMRYGNPSIHDSIDQLRAQGCEKIGILPLYPQFAGATTASVYDGVAKSIKKRMDVPELRFVRDYYRDPRYITALGQSITEHLGGLDWTPDIILTSYHGLPQSYVDKGDPYQGECLATTTLLRRHMGYTDTFMPVTFQSRFGPKAWLQPYTDKTLEALPAQGIKNVAIMTPGFAADCLETLEEINIEARESFLDHGGVNFTMIPCLNDNILHLDLLAGLIEDRLLNGWGDGGENILG